MRRIAVVGTTGSGKTTLAKRLSASYGIPHVELDALFHGPNWTPSPPEEFRARVARALAGDGFVVDGGYSIARDIAWARLDTLVWLDYSFAVCFTRTVRRTLSRIRSGAELWNGNRESWRGAFLSRESILLWVIQTHGKRRREYPAIIAGYPIPNVVRLRSPRETEAWLRSLDAADASRGSGAQRPPKANPA